MTLGTLVRGGQGQRGPLLALLVSGVFCFLKIECIYLYCHLRVFIIELVSVVAMIFHILGTGDLGRRHP